MSLSTIFGTINVFISSNLTLISTIVSISLALSICSYFYLKNLYSFFEKLGIKNPPTYPLVGNLATILFSDRMVLAREWSQKYGKFYGVFHGTKPRFVVADPEVLRQICIKDFDAMPNHEASELLNDYQKHFLISLQDDHWKRVRAMQSPTFTSGKIKRMFKLLDKCCDDLIRCFDEQLEGKPTRSAHVNLKEIYSLYTLDCIASAAYSMKLERKGSSSIKSASSRNQFVAMANKIFEFNMVRLFVNMIFPKRILKAIGFKASSPSKYQGLAERLRQLIKTRKDSGKKFDDYLQLLIDAKLDDKMELDALDDKENHHAGLTSATLRADQEKMLSDIKRVEGDPEEAVSNGYENGIANSNGLDKASPYTSVKLNDIEIVSSALFLLVVGIETTASLLTNCTYALAFHQDIQDRLYETVKGLAQFNESDEYSFEYESLTASPYLDAVISETLRALSPVIELDRMPNRDYRIEKYNVTVKRGEKILLAYHAIMNNPEFFPEPTKFDPERFMPENRDKIVPGSYCPFGLGPRHCIGMRFSLTEAKFALARVLMKYKFVPAPDTSYPPQSRRSLGLNNLAKPVVEMQVR